MPETTLTRHSLALEGLKHKPCRTICLTAIVAIFAFMLFGGSVFYGNLSRGLDSLSDRLGADLLVVPYGYEKETHAALLRGEPSTFYFKADLLDKVRSIPGVSQASPQFFLSSLAAGCCTAKVQIIGYDPVSDFLVRSWLRDKVDALHPSEVVVGAKIIPELGGNIQLYGTTYRVAAKMDATGMGFDTSIFMPLPAVYDLMRASKLVAGDAHNISDFISSIAVKVEPGFAPKDVANEILRQYAVDYNLDMMVTKNMLTDLGGRLKNLAVIIYGLAGVFWFMAVLVLFIVFSSTLNERKRELSLLRILGASRGWLARLVLLESVYIGIGGALAGIAAAALVVFPFDQLIFNAFGLPHLQISYGAAAASAMLTLLAAGAVGPLACLYSALSITRFDIYNTLREGE